MPGEDGRGIAVNFDLDGLRFVITGGGNGASPASAFVTGSLILVHRGQLTWRGQRDCGAMRHREGKGDV